jgi:hypothetical protein
MATAIAEKEGCPCRFVDTVVVLEKFKDKTVWHGLVSLLLCIGRKKKFVMPG